MKAPIVQRLERAPVTGKTRVQLPVGALLTLYFMEQLQIIFDRIEENKRKIKDIKTLYKDALKNSLDYQDTVSKLTTLREKKKKIEAGIRDQYTSEFAKLDEFALEVKTDTELLSDAALSTLMKGERVEVKDRYENVHDPIFKVKFKKVKK